MPMIQEFYFDSADGETKIYTKEWQPDDGQPKAILQISHGVSEHIERYDDFARFMTQNGFLVVGNDHLGHGKTVLKTDDYGFFDEKNGWNKVVEDMHTLYSIEREKHLDLPYFILGHSMGSFLTRTYIINYTHELDGVIISGTGQNPRLEINAAIMLATTAERRQGLRTRSPELEKLAFGAFNKKFENRTEFDWLSRDWSIVDKFVEDPLCGFISTVGLFKDMFGGLYYISDKKNLKKMQKDLPVLFISGDMDPVGHYGKSVKKTYKSFLNAGCTDVTIKLYPQGRHEMLNETNKEEVYADVLAWLNAKLATKK